MASPLRSEDKSSSWKLPPNVYRIKDSFEALCEKQMGKLGPYQCFTVERDSKTIVSRIAAKRDEDQSDIFHDVPTTMNDMMLKPSNRYKTKFLKSQRFDTRLQPDAPPPTKYYPQNYVLKPKSVKERTKDASIDKPLLFYPHTTVPIKEMTFNKENFPRPAPGRYDPHDVTCKCHLTKNLKRCPGSVAGEGHSHVFQSTAFRLVHPLPPSRKKYFSKPSADDDVIQYFRPEREPFSFRMRRSQSTDELAMTGREMRFNTMVKKRNLFSVKTGRPVAFLSASPRFRENSEIALSIEKEKTKLDVYDDKPRRKRITMKRLTELAVPKYPPARISSVTNETQATRPITESHEAAHEVVDKLVEITLEAVEEISSTNIVR